MIFWLQSKVSSLKRIKFGCWRDMSSFLVLLRSKCLRTSMSRTFSIAQILSSKPDFYLRSRLLGQRQRLWNVSCPPGNPSKFQRRRPPGNWIYLRVVTGMIQCPKDMRSILLELKPERTRGRSLHLTLLLESILHPKQKSGRSKRPHKFFCWTLWSCIWFLVCIRNIFSSLNFLNYLITWLGKLPPDQVGLEVKTLISVQFLQSKQLTHQR